MNVKYLLLILVAALLNASASVLMKLGSEHLILDKGLWKFIVSFLNIKTISGVVFFGLNFVIFSIAYKHVDLNVAYSIMLGVSYVLVLLLSILFIRETINIIQILGFIFVFIGVILIIR